VYQGQEIGMLNWRPDDPSLYEDVQTRYQYEHAHTKESPEKRLHRLWRSSRDSARTPVQWDNSPHAGFTTGNPWFSVNPNYTEINVAAQESDPDSILHFYRKAIALRKSLPVVRNGNYREYFHRNRRLYVYTRTTAEQTLLVLCSFSDTPQKLRVPRSFDPDRAKLLLCNYAEPQATLQPYEARVYLLEHPHSV
jgi:oligo-1,6-glucosidase